MQGHERLLLDLSEYSAGVSGTTVADTFGNLLLTALTNLLGGTERAIEEAGRLLRNNGRILSVTLENTTLCARLANE
jgi:2-phospho-L-lactate transferase/gluconeogenesis factor (CofD/UPF0052 family)